MSDASEVAGAATGDAGGTDRADGDALLRVEGLKKHFPAETGLLAGIEFDPRQFPPVTKQVGRVKAVDGVDLEIRRGETLGLVGESGCGKSTLGRTILRLLEPTDGRIYFQGENLADLSGEALRRKRSEMQLIFQDPQSSLDPRMTVGQIIEEPMAAHDMRDDEGREARAKTLLEQVGLDANHYERYPHEFSGGQRQRVNLARALSVEPDFVVCDEPVSALDVSVQAQVLNTMEELQAEYGLTFLFIAHDLSVVRHIADRVAVMYLGNVVELAEKEELFENPKHPYTKALLESIPTPNPRRRGERGVLEGDVPSPQNPPSGCRFRTRCPRLIAPERYDLTDEEWAATRAFVRAVDRRTIEPLPEADLRERFFADAEPRGEAENIVEEAISLVATEGSDTGASGGDPIAAGDDADREERDERWDEARELLFDAFVRESICAREQPDYAVDAEYGDGAHDVACHLYR